MKSMRNTITAMLLVSFALVSTSLESFAEEVVLFDEGHGQQFLIAQNGPLDLSGLSALFQSQGLQVTAGRGMITDEMLAGVDALVISGAFKPITAPETSAILRFLEKGGRLCVMLHIGSPVADLLRSLSVSISNGVIHEPANTIHDNGLDFYVIDLKPHDLTRGLGRFGVFGGWALLNNDTSDEVIARTSEKAWIDLNRNQVLDSKDAVQPFAVAITGKRGNGHFVVFGDDAIFQNRFLVEENALLAKNLAQWLQQAD